MLSNIAKARKVPSDLINVSSIYESERGAVIEYSHARALPVHSRRELEFNVRKSVSSTLIIQRNFKFELGKGDIKVHDGTLVDFMVNT